MKRQGFDTNRTWLGSGAGLGRDSWWAWRITIKPSQECSNGPIQFQPLTAGQRNGKCCRGGNKRDWYTIKGRKTLNSRFLEALLGYLWSMPTLPTVLSPSWSSLWLDAQLGATLAMLARIFSPNYCPGYLKCSLPLHGSCTFLPYMTTNDIYYCEIENFCLKRLQPASCTLTFACDLLQLPNQRNYFPNPCVKHLWPITYNEGNI